MPLNIDPKRNRAWLRRVRQLQAGQASMLREPPPPPPPAPAEPAPKAPRREQTGLGALGLRGWAVSYDALLRIRLTRGGMDTGYHDTEREACDRARDLEKAQQ